MIDDLSSAVEARPPRIADAEGSMEHAPLVYALVHALDRAITGEMVFHAPTGEVHSVTFFEGAPVRVEPGVEGERIGEDLVAMDYLREDALAAAMVTAQTSRRRLGELLVEAEAVDPDVLTEALTLQTARRLARLANLPGESTFSLYFSARAEPEPHAPWAPLDTLLATVRAWTDRSRLHGTLRWLMSKPLSLSTASNLDALMLTSRERDAVALMRAECPSLKQLYARVGKGLSSLLYVLAVTRQFTFTESKGAPLGVRKSSDMVGDLVQVAVPIGPVIAPSEGSASELEGSSDEGGSVPPPAPLAEAPETVPEAPLEEVATEPVEAAPAVAPPAPSAPAMPAVPRPRRKVSIPLDAVTDVPPGVAARAAVAAIPPPPPPPPAPSEPAAPPPVYAAASAPPAGVAAPAPRLPPRPSFSPPKFVDQGRPPGRIAEPQTRPAAMEMSVEFRRAEDAAKVHDYETAARILQERCPDEDTASPDFQALSAWVKANKNKTELSAAVSDLTYLLMSHNDCQSALYYRGLLLKRSGKEKAALRDFVVLVKENPTHAGALTEIKLLRESAKK